MIVHHESLILSAIESFGGHQVAKSQVFSTVFSSTKGGARRNKMNKAWKKLVASGRIIRTPSKRYLAA